MFGASPTRVRRLAAILAAGLLAAWMAALIAGYAGDEWAARSYEPPPERVAAIVKLVEETPPGARPTLLAALQTPIFRVTILPPGAEPASPRSDEALMRRYAPALDPRPFTAARALAPPSAADPAWLGFPRRRQDLIQVALPSGERLSIAATSPTIVTRFGIPVGIGAGAAGILIALVALGALWREIRPLAQLARATERIDLSGRPVTLPDTRGQSHEIRALAQAISRLQERLSSVLANRMALIGGISHDLRTFTTRLRLRVEAIPDPAQRERAVADIEDMMRLLDDALLAARGGAGPGTQDLVDLAGLVAAEADDLAARGLPVSLVPGAPREDLYVIGDALALRRVVVNLAENAVRYGRAARLSLVAEAESLTLRVHDDGPGIPPALRAALQEPFARGESSRNRATGGAGLGLAVARSLVEAHEGRLSLDPQANGGATAAVTLPRFAEL